MNERVAVSQANSLQLANLVRSQVVRVTKPQSDQAVIIDLNNGNDAKLDLSAVADEKMTLVHVDTKLVILFDNQSTVTAEPFFDLSGKPLASLNVELSAGRTLNGEQFAQSVPITDDQSVLPGSDPSSGADFRNVSIDSMPGSASPLALMAQEMSGIFGRGSTDTGADFGVVAHAQLFSTPAQTVTGSGLIINIPPPGGAGTQVFEAGLLASRGFGESAGTHPGSPAFQTTTRSGTISFSSPNGLDSVTVGGETLHVGDTKTIADGTTGFLTASLTSDAIHYTYTLLDNTLGVPTASFAVVVIDANHVPAGGGNLVINIVDDAPRAIGDTDHVSATDPSTDGNVIDGSGTTSGVADVAGADGGLHVVGIAFGNTVGTVGVALAGANGTLTIDAQGHYNYTRTGSGTAPDVYTYKVADADGTQSTSQLAIAVDNAAPGGFTFPTATRAHQGRAAGGGGRTQCLRCEAKKTQPGGGCPAAAADSIRRLDQAPQPRN